jgi:hypothetical protein
VKYMKLSPLSLALNDHCLEQFADCFELIHVKPNGDILSQRSPGGHECGHGDYFVVGEGQIDISVKVPTSNKKTDYAREVLCTKRQGDILYIPALENLACNIDLEKRALQQHGVDADGRKMTSQFNRVKRRSAELVNIMLRSIKSTHLNSSFGNLEPMDANDDDIDTVLGGSGGGGGGASLKNMRKPMKMLGMTSSTSPYGAILLRLNREKFDLFKQKALEESMLENLEGSDDGGSVSSSGTSASGSNPQESHKPTSLFSVLRSAQVAPMENTNFTTKRRVSKNDLEFLSVMMTSNIQDHLKRISFLKGLPMSKIQTLGEMSVFEVMPPNHIVCEEGQEVSFLIHSALHVFF